MCVKEGQVELVCAMCCVFLQRKSSFPKKDKTDEGQEEDRRRNVLAQQASTGVSLEAGVHV